MTWSEDRVRGFRWPIGSLCCVMVWGLVSPGEAAPPKVASNPPTFITHVGPLLRENCQGCHRAGQVGPFALDTYEQARKRAKDLAAVVESGEMPPWKPEQGYGPELKHSRTLSPEEIATIQAWADAGAPLGEGADLLPVAPGAEEWVLGEPDLVLEATEAFTVPANGPDLYRCFVIPSNLSADVSVSAIEYRPGNRRVVHHMMAFIDTAGGGRARDQAEPGPGYTSYSGAGVDVTGDLGGWAAGNAPTRLPEGVGRILAKGSDILVQVHYHPSGKPEQDRPSLAFYFCKTPVRQTLQWANASNEQFKLIPGKSDIEIKATWFVPLEVEALAVTPHMHALGRDFRMTLTYPDGKTRGLLHIADWDPAWQDTYFFKERVTLPKNSTVTVIARYDNSAHSRNPHKPPKLVMKGHEVTDEMCVGYIGIVKTGQDLTQPGHKDDLFEALTRQYIQKQFRLRDQAEQRRRERLK